MSSPVLPHGSPHAGWRSARYVVHKTFPGRGAFIPSNPVREKSVPGYAASERRRRGGLDPKRHAGPQVPAGWVRCARREQCQREQSRCGAGDGSTGTTARP